MKSERTPYSWYKPKHNNKNIHTCILKANHQGLVPVSFVKYLRYDTESKCTGKLEYEVFEDKFGRDKHLIIINFYDGFALWDVTVGRAEVLSKICLNISNSSVKLLIYLQITISEAQEIGP